VLEKVLAEEKKSKKLSPTCHYSSGSHEETAMMAGSSARTAVLKQLGTILRFGVVGDLSDSQLLHRFLTGRDGAEQAAFAALVERHGPMVLRVCRQVLGNPHDAQDAFQATFLVLARKASAVRNAESLASWLHGIALRVAVRAKVDEARRRVHERAWAEMKQREVDEEAVRSECCPELHEAIARLPERYREPVVLCYLEGMTSEQAAMRIGCPPGTVWSRLSTARQRLRRRLVRGGVALSGTLLAAELTPPASAALSRALLDATVAASVGFAARRATEAALASELTITLARGVLCAMTMSKLKTLGAIAVACALALAGMQTLTLGQSRERSGAQEPAAAAPAGDDSYTALSRSLDKLGSELDETTQRSAEMRKDLQRLRVVLKALGGGLRPDAGTEAAAQFASVLESQPFQAVTRLAQQLKRHPAQPKPAPGRVGLYMLDVKNGEVTLIADQPAPGLTYCGTPAWSHNGRRIVFDATPGTEWSLTRLRSIDLGEDRPTVRDFGAGNCPTFSPRDDRIIFLSNADGAETGVWLMKADGSDRRLLGHYGKPTWSPDGRQLMIVSFQDPREVTLMDADPEKSGVIQLPGHQIFSHATWAGKGTIVAAIVAAAGDTIALIDVSDPREAKVKEVLWHRANGPDVKPRYPIYSAVTRRCIFAGSEAEGMMAFYSVQHGADGPAKPVRSQESHSWIADLAYSPDGRYILYSAKSREPAEEGRAPALPHALKK
jgi:RNA polymerase sigma factor (sigma-70 family)